MDNQTPIPRQEVKIIAIQQQPKSTSPQTVIFDIYQVKRLSPKGSNFELLEKQKTSDFERAIKCGHLQPMGFIACAFRTETKTIILPQTSHRGRRDILVINSQLSQFNPNDRSFKNTFSAHHCLYFNCPIPPNATEEQKLDFQKDMFNYSVLHNVEKYAIHKKLQKVSYFRTYFISEMPNGWGEIAYQLNPNEYPFIQAKTF
jgi:hypothetical protein